MPVTRKYERDIDLLLAEEISVCQDFLAWFISRTKFSELSLSVIDVDASRSDTTGESDLVVLLQDNISQKTLALHIEDKIDAPMQPDQSARYRRRGDLGISRGDYSDFEIVLCAPQSYLSEHPEATSFERHIAYEDIADFIRSRDSSPRSKYRAEFIASATSRRLNSWKQTNDEITRTFWQEAYAIAIQEYPTLEMRTPNFTKDQTWISFRPHDFPTMPKRIYVMCKGSNGLIDLTFSNCVAHRLKELIDPLLSKVSGARLTVHQTGKSAAVRIHIKGFTVRSLDEECIDRLHEAFQAAAVLISFYRDNRAQLDQAAMAASRGI